jgi:uncharacterized lipoprotein
MRRKSVVLGIVALGSLCFGGCALTTAKIDLQYVPQTGVAKIEESKSIVVNVQVNDNRMEKVKVSSKKNGYGMEMAQIIPVEEVSTTFKKAIECELKSRGFSLGNNDALVSIDADLTKFYNDFKMGFFSGDAIAELNLGVTVKNKKGDLVFSRQIVSQGIEPNIQITGGENARLALEKALTEGMQKLFTDKTFISALLKSSQG